jgi:hypothetical protein
LVSGFGYHPAGALLIYQPRTLYIKATKIDITTNDHIIILILELVALVMFVI